MNYGELLREIQMSTRPLVGRGAVADYIPALARVSPEHFGMALATTDGTLYATGEAEVPFSVQSISKLFILMLTMSAAGEEVWSRVGREPSGTPFNSLVELEYSRGVPRNPFMNAGALVVLDLLADRVPDTEQAVRDYVRVLSRNFAIAVDDGVARSERRSGARNAALAHLLKDHGRLTGNVSRLLTTYCRLCALSMSCVDLARYMLPLANGGISPPLGEAVLTPRQVKRLNALMLTCGMYDSVGNFAFRVGLPAKSGVGGGIVAVLPGEYAVAVWAPELDLSGNSLIGTAALEQLTTITRRSLF